IRPKDKNIPVVRLNKVVGAFIHEHLVARIDRTSRDNFSTMEQLAGKDVKILTERVGRGVNQKTLPLTYQSRKCEKEAFFRGYDLENLVVLSRNHVNVIATLNDKFDDLFQKVWRRLVTRTTNNSV